MARLGLGLGIVGFLVWILGPAAVWATLREANPAGIAVAFALFLGVLAFRVLRLRRILLHFGLEESSRALAGIYLESMAIGLLIGGGIGADSARTVRLARRNRRLLGPAAATIVERFTGLAALSVLAGGVILVADALPIPAAILGAVAAASFGGSVAVLIAVPHLPRLVERTRGRWPAWLAALPARLGLGALGAQEFEPRRWRSLLAGAFVTGLGLQLNVLLTYGAICWSLGIGTTWTDVFTLFPLIEIASMAPLTVNNIGVKEGLMVAFLARAGQPPHGALGLAIVYRSFEAVFAIAGAALLALDRGRADEPF